MSISKYHSHLLVVLLVLLVSTWSCQPPSEQHLINLNIENGLPIVRQHLPIRIPLDQLKSISPDFTFSAFALAMGDPTDRQNPPKRIPYQADDLNYDGEKDELVFLLDFQANQAQTAVIQYAPGQAPKEDGDPIAIELIFQRKSQAGIFPSLAVPVALESNLSLFLLQTNGAISAFSKDKSSLHLQQVAQNKTISELEGLIQVGESQERDRFGVGGFAIWDNQERKFISIRSDSDYVRVPVSGGLRATTERIWPKLIVDKQTSVSVLHRSTVYADNAILQQQVLIDGLNNRLSVVVGLTEGVVIEKSLLKWENRSVSAIVLPLSNVSATGDSTLLFGSNAEWETYLFHSADQPIQSMEELEKITKLLVASLNSPPSLTLSLPKKNKKENKSPPNSKNNVDDSENEENETK